MSMPREINGIVYDTNNEKLAKVLEAIRQRQKQPNPFRIRVKWVSGEFKPYEGYIVHTEPCQLTEWDEKVMFPLIAWKSNSSSGKRLDPALIETIAFASRKDAIKHGGSYIYKRENNYFSSICSHLLAEAQFLK